MASITVNVNGNDKLAFSSICEQMGMNISTAINVFIKAVNRKRGLPFEVTAGLADDGFYSDANLSHIRASLKKLESGEGKTFSVAENSVEYDVNQ